MTAGYVTPGIKMPHTPRNPCPLCGGHRDLPSGKGVRCNGLTQGDYVYCQRVEAPRANALGTYKHYMRGRCHCGADHSGYTPPVYYEGPKREGRNRTEHRRNEGTKRFNQRVTDYLIQDKDGTTVAIHHRVDYTDENGEKHKITPWRQTNGAYGLGGLRTTALPLYGTELLRGYEPACAVILTEGEKAADWLRAHDVKSALGTVTGAPTCPDRAVLEVLCGHDVILWPDADFSGEGEHHMDMITVHLHALGIRVFRLDVSSFPDKFDAADWAGTDEELYAYLRTATRVPAPLVEEDGPAAVEEASRQLDERHVHRKALRTRLSETFDATNVEHLIERANKIAVCMERWMPALCRACGARPALIVTCHENLCPLCFQRRFLNDWMVRVEEDPRLKDIRWRLVRFIPREAVQGDKALKTLRNRFTEQRKRDHIQAGIIGNRCSREHGGVILLALPMECAVPETMGSFVAELVREDASERDLSSWLISEYEDEIREAIEAGEQGDTQYVIDWEASTRGRKRFSAFGKLYRTPGCEPDEQGTATGGADDVVAIPLVGFTGGNGHAGVHEKRKCPACGSPKLSTERPYITADEVQNTKGYTECKPRQQI